MANPAECCKQALRDATTRWPQRNRASDGIMGDTAHQMRRSDHNDGNAFDLTHDPQSGVDCNVLSRLVISDARMKYVIWKRQIFSKERAGEGWRVYSGTNPHTKHLHVSILANSRNILTPWPWSGAAEISGALPFPGKLLRVNSRGLDVKNAQRRLIELGREITADGVFGANTRQSVISFQQSKNLSPDGVIGENTWNALFAV